MPRECLKIIESKSKVRQSRNKAVVAKMSTSSSTQAVSSDVAELKDMAAAANFNQANSGYRPPMVSNQIRPPGFPPVQNPHANNQNNFNRGNNFNQNRGNNFNQGQIYRPPVHQPVVNQPVAHQGPAPQTHGYSFYFRFLELFLYTDPNPKEDLKGITTDWCYHPRPKAVNQCHRGDKDTMPPANNEAPSLKHQFHFHHEEDE
ncbi:hypothetical protein Tco_0270775 [Tanacetum coccineum]